MAYIYTYLEKTSLSSCSDTNCPKLATNSVEQGAFAANGGFDGCVGLFEEPTGLAKAGLDKKWWCAVWALAAAWPGGPVAAAPGGNPAAAAAAAAAAADICIAVVGCKAVACWWCCVIVVIWVCTLHCECV